MITAYRLNNWSTFRGLLGGRLLAYNPIQPTRSALCRGRFAGLFWSAAEARRRSKKVGDGAAFAGKNCFQRFTKKFRSILTIIWLPFLDIKNCKKNKYTATVTPAARRKIFGDGYSPINKSRRRRQYPWIVGGAGVVWESVRPHPRSMLERNVMSHACDYQVEKS